jgi:hypothetical protein
VELKLLVVIIKFILLHLMDVLQFHSNAGTPAGNNVDYLVVAGGGGGGDDLGGGGGAGGYRESLVHQLDVIQLLL